MWLPRHETKSVSEDESQLRVVICPRIVESINRGGRRKAVICVCTLLDVCTLLEISELKSMAAIRDRAIMIFSILKEIFFAIIIVLIFWPLRKPVHISINHR